MQHLGKKQGTLYGDRGWFMKGLKSEDTKSRGRGGECDDL